MDRAQLSTPACPSDWGMLGVHPIGSRICFSSQSTPGNSFTHSMVLWETCNSFWKEMFYAHIIADVIFVCNNRKAIIIYPLYLYSIIPFKREL